MRSQCRLLIAFALYVSWSVAPAAERGVSTLETMPPQIRNAASALVQVIGVFDGTQRPAGMGFLVSPQGHALTSASSIAQATEIFLTAPVLGEVPLKAYEIANNKQADITLLKVDVFKPTPCIKIYESFTVTHGDIGVALGFKDEEKGRAPLCAQGVIVGFKQIPGRGRLIQFDRTFPSYFLGAPVLSRNGAALGIVVAGPSIPSEGGWCAPIGPARELMELNAVPYIPQRTVWSYLNRWSLLSFILVALLLYAAYIFHVWQTKGKNAAMRQLPEKGTVICILASGLIHLIILVVVLVKQQEWGIRYYGTEATEVGVISVGEGEGGIGLPVAMPPAVPTLSQDRPITRPPIQQLDVKQAVTEKVEETVKALGEEASRADSDAQAAARKAHEGVIAGVQAGAAGRGQARAALEKNIADLLSRLPQPGEGGGGGTAGPALPGEAKERAARRARWRIEIPIQISLFEFIDKHGAEMATWSRRKPDILYYISNLTGQIKVRTGLVSQEPRYHWVPIGFDPRREQEEEAFRSVGLKVEPDDPIVLFFPTPFEEMLAKLEKQFRETHGLRSPPKSTIFLITPNLDPVVIRSE